MRYLPLASLAFLTLAAPAIAAPAPAPGTAMMAKPGENKPASLCAQVPARQAASLDNIAAQLALTPKQQPLFDAWKKIKLEKTKSFPCDAVGMGTGAPPKTVLDRVELQRQMAAYQLGMIQAELPSLTALYNSLTPKQKEVLDQPMPGRMANHGAMMGGAKPGTMPMQH